MRRKEVHEGREAALGKFWSVILSAHQRATEKHRHASAARDELVTRAAIVTSNFGALRREIIVRAWLDSSQSLFMSACRHLLLLTLLLSPPDMCCFGDGLVALQLTPKRPAGFGVASAASSSTDGPPSRRLRSSSPARVARGCAGSPCRVKGRR